MFCRVKPIFLEDQTPVEKVSRFPGSTLPSKRLQELTRVKTLSSKTLKVTEGNQVEPCVEILNSETIRIKSCTLEEQKFTILLIYITANGCF